MKKIKRYRKGNRIYTRLDKLTKQVTVLSKKVPKKEQHLIDVSIDSKIAEGKTSNLARISHNKEEFVIDFFQCQGNKAKLCSRIIISPIHAKRLCMALCENMRKYEKDKKN